MIDNVEKTLALMARLRAALPARAVASRALRKMLEEESKPVLPRECRITEVRYLGDEGGIMCTLDFDIGDTKKAYIVSITHLRLDPGNPLAREVGKYCKHRIKRLKKLHRGIV